MNLKNLIKVAIKQILKVIFIDYLAMGEQRLSEEQIAELKQVSDKVFT